MTGIAVILFTIAIGTAFVWLGWNLFMPSMFGMKEINFTQAFGLMLLGTSLFKASSVKTT